MAHLPTAFGSCWGFTILAFIAQATGPYVSQTNAQGVQPFPGQPIPGQPFAAQPPITGNPSYNPAGAPSQSGDNFQPPVPTTTFIDPKTGQLYGRFIETETVTVPKYQYEPVKVRNWTPRWVTEERQTTQTQYTPSYTWQLQPRTISSWNPFAPPQQTWEYVPIVQYQANYVPVTQPVTYQKYEEVEVTMMIPKLVNVSERVPKYADKPLTNPPPGGTPLTYNAAVPSNVAAFPGASNPPVQQVVSNLPTRPIDGPYYRNAGFNTNYGYPRSASYIAIAPQPYYAQQQPPITAMAATTPPPSNPSSIPSTAIPMVAVNNFANPYYANLAAQQRWTGYPNYLPAQNQYYPTQPYNAMASRPVFQWPLLATTNGPLFQGGLFSNNSGTSLASNGTPVYPANYVASSTPMSSNYSPYSGTSNYSSYNGNAGYMGSPAYPPTSNWYSGAPSSFSFRPTSVNQAYPNQSSWGVAPPNTFRDPTQMGMPATVMR